MRNMIADLDADIPQNDGFTRKHGMYVNLKT